MLHLQCVRFNYGSDVYIAALAETASKASHCLLTYPVQLSAAAQAISECSSKQLSGVISLKTAMQGPSIHP